MTERKPQTEHGRRLRSRVSDERWERIVAEADERAAVYKAVAERRKETKESWRVARAAAAEQTPQSTFVRYKRHVDQRTGPTWERLLDGRVPPDRSVAQRIVDAACLLRRLDPDVGVDAARTTLVEHFGEEGNVSDTWLKRVWADAGLNRPAGGHNEHPGMHVELFYGGAGLALLAAAAAELGTTESLAKAALRAGERVAEAQSVDVDNLRDEVSGRDELGHFTAEYNARWREGLEPGSADDRWGSDARKAARRDLSTLQVMSNKAPVLAAKMLAMGVAPLVTERRGFDGLAGPAGAWLGVLGITPYAPATLDKALAELGLLAVDDALWRTHSRTWYDLSARWKDDDTTWPRSVAYVDGTADPYWTRAFARSGKVSRVGRVMPCLSRVAIHSGQGVPLLIETHAGAVSLKRRLLPMLRRLDEAIGPSAAVGRLTVIDAEVGTAGMIWAMHEQTEMGFVTVLKGLIVKGAEVSLEQPWQPFRERDEVRDVEVYLRGKHAPAEGIRLRGVQMRRADGRRPQTTLFATNVDLTDLSAPEVASWYLSRWPRQEQRFRTARNGGGLNRSHGYGGEYVTHVALEDKQARARRSVERATASHEAAAATRGEFAAGLAEAPTGVRRKALKLADNDVRAKARQVESREQADAKLQSLPDQIRERDTTRDSIMTCLKLNVLSLVEFVLQEYFAGTAMEWRTFIEKFIPMPVTVRSNKRRCVYELHGNPRDPASMVRLRSAVDELNRRRIKRGKQLLVFELRDETAGGP